MPITFQPGDEIEKNVQLQPTGVDDWTLGIAVQEIEVTPSTAYLGQSVDIGVHVWYLGSPSDLPIDIYGTVWVDGTELKKTGWTLHSTAAVMHFDYITQSVGIFTATAQDKSASFEVIEDVVSTFWCPYGIAGRIILDSYGRWGFAGSGGEVEPGVPYTSKGDLIDALVKMRMKLPRLPEATELIDYASFIVRTLTWGGVRPHSLCPICGKPVYFSPQGNYYECYTNVVDHITNAHPDYPWEQPKGGIVAWYPDTGELTGIIRKPGSYSGQFRDQRYTPGGPRYVDYSVTIPNWGDRVYIDMDTGEAYLVTFERIIT